MENTASQVITEVKPRMNHNISNSASRIWTNRQLAQTVKQAKAGGFKIEKLDGFTRIYDAAFFPDESDKLILSSLPMVPGRNVVRIDKSYFENESKEMLEEQRAESTAEHSFNQQHPECNP
jgi:hypothetical protein